MPEEGPVLDVPVIAIVDDDASFREALERFLGTCGFRVRSFASGEELLESSELGFISCLLLDLAMPEVSGLEVQQQLRARRLQVPTVFATAHADDEVEQHLVAAGAIAILPKPVDQQMLLRLVQRMMGIEPSDLFVLQATGRPPSAWSRECESPPPAEASDSVSTCRR